MTSCSTKTPKHNIYKPVWLLGISVIDGTYCVVISPPTNASDYQHGREKLCFYATRGCPVGTSFQHKLTNLCTREPALELGKESRKQSPCYTKDNMFLFVLAEENMQAVKRTSMLLHNPSEFILTTRKYLKTASER